MPEETLPEVVAGERSLLFYRPIAESPGEWNEVGQIIGVTPPAITFDEVETTPNQGGSKTFRRSKKRERSPMNFNVEYNPSDESHAELLSMLELDEDDEDYQEIVEWKIEYFSHHVTKATDVFPGYLLSWTPNELERGGSNAEAACAVRPTGPIVRTPASDTPES